MLQLTHSTLPLICWLCWFCFLFLNRTVNQCRGSGTVSVLWFINSNIADHFRPLSWSFAAPVGVNHPPEPLLQARLCLGSSAEPPSLLAVLKEPSDTSAATTSQGGVFTGANMAPGMSSASDALCLYCVEFYKTHLHLVIGSQYSVGW